MRRQPPGTQLLDGEQAGETGPPGSGGHLKGEVPDGVEEMVFRGTHFMVHVTQRGGTCFRE
ncbi:hypothetical protein ACE1SV_24440 [Streptomyces sennicomposti]